MPYAVKINIKSRLFVVLSALVILGAGSFALVQFSKPPKTAIKKQDVAVTDFDKGQVIEGTNAGDAKTLKTADKVTYQSPALATNQPKTTAVSIDWSQQDAAGSEPKLQVRIFNGKSWT